MRDSQSRVTVRSWKDVYKRQAIARPECVDVERSITRLFEDACGDFCQRQRSDSCDEGIGTEMCIRDRQAMHGVNESGSRNDERDGTRL